MVKYLLGLIQANHLLLLLVQLQQMVIVENLCLMFVLKKKLDKFIKGVGTAPPPRQRPQHDLLVSPQPHRSIVVGGTPGAGKDRGVNIIQKVTVKQDIGPKKKKKI